MAKPRVFISSTCYDLKELRSQIREFINDYGYDPVLSEYGDIFFEYGTHPQDACFAEVAKCHMFLLIIGNTYGSFYHNSDTVKPASVTMKEFEEALDKKIPKHVFINRFVEYDYQNYSRAWANKLKLNKGKGILSDDPNEVDKLKEEFDSLYPFPHESYRHLFRFINLLYKNNVSVITFEYAEDIKKALVKQWAGAMFEYLTAEKTTPNEYIYDLNIKLDRLTNTMSKLVVGKRDGEGSKVTFDLSAITEDQNLSTIEEIKNKIFTSLQDILPYNSRRHAIKRKTGKTFTEDDVIEWIAQLNDNLDVFKWRPYLKQRELLLNLTSKLSSWYSISVNPVNVANLCRVINTCKESFTQEEYKSLIRAIADELNSMEVEEEDVELPF